MSRIIKTLKKGNKIRVKDRLEMPEWGEFVVEGIYQVPGKKDITVACKRVSTGKTYMFGEDQVLKYRKLHLRLVK